ncbi:MAG: outer membrane beta-barrel protein [Porphyromonas sp.]|nr:outer membrane beta-barrel protein [Porphyromonas sp.]
MINRKLKALVIGGLLGLLGMSTANAQVDGVNFTLSPNISYNWWNQNIALNNSPFYGLRVGVGFGPYVELRGAVEKSINLKNTLQDKEWNPLSDNILDKLEGMDMDITRVGGELKFNILSSRYTVSPYLTVGGGVQLLKYNPFDTEAGVIEDAKSTEKQIYLAAGAGVRFNLTDRIALSLEGRNTQFNLNHVNYLLNPNVDDDAKRWGNWSALASLDIILGGMSGQSDMSKQYSNLFEDGFRGVKFVLEPGVMYADFHENLSQPDQWFVGGAAGLDFSSLIGLRAFYYQGTKDPQKLNFEFDNNLKMYGANLLLRLNQPRGIVPYLTVGAGYLDDKGLIPTDPNATDPNASAEERFDIHNLFLMGGAGIEIPFSKYVALFGNVNAMLSSDNNKWEETEVDNIYTSLTYNAGLRINIGAAAYEPTFPTYGEEVSDDTNQGINERVNASRSMDRESIFRKERVRTGDMMTKQEFEEMVDRILYKIRAEENARATQFSQSEMDIIISALNAQNGTNNPQVTTQNMTDQQMVNEMRRLVDRMDRMERTNYNRGTTTQVVPVQRANPVVTAPVTSQPGTQVGTTQVREQFLKLNRLAAVTGVNFGENTQWMLGLRGYMQVSDTDIDFVPELMVGFGNESAFNLSANTIYNFVINNSPVDPYAGFGLGVYNHGLGLKFGVNLIAGANFDLGTPGELFVDYVSRGLFKNNQIIVGYRFVF